jgi:hypothetical protein
MALMQQGLPAAYDFADILYVTDEPANKSKLDALGQSSFKRDLAAIIINNFKDYIPTTKRLINIPEIPQLVIATFDTELWNRLSQSTVNVYKPIWNDSTRSKLIDPNFAPRKRDFYKFDIKILLQVKKNAKGDNPLTAKVEQLLTNQGLRYRKI